MLEQSTPERPAVSQRPDDLQEARLERDLQLSRLAEGIAPLLFICRHFHYDGNGIGPDWSHASEKDRRECRALAEQAVMAINQFHRNDAVVAVRQLLEARLKDAAEIVARDWDTHSSAMLIRSCLRDAINNFLLADPAEGLLAAYARALQLPADLGQRADDWLTEQAAKDEAEGGGQ